MAVLFVYQTLMPEAPASADVAYPLNHTIRLIASGALMAPSRVVDVDFHCGIDGSMADLCRCDAYSPLPPRDILAARSILQPCHRFQPERTTR